MSRRTILTEAEPSRAGLSIHAGGEMAALVSRTDWTHTPLGSIETWAPLLLSYVNLVLCSKQPAFLAWGSNLALIYNDGVVPTLGHKHPTALGRSYRDVFSEAWPIVGPELEACLSRGETAIHENSLVPIVLQGRSEDRYFTYSVLPIYDGDRIAGVFVPYQDTTNAIVAAQQLRTAETRSDQILQSIGDGVIVTDSQGQIVRMNPVSERVTGWNSAEAVGKPLVTVFQLIHEVTRQTLGSPADKVLKLGSVVGLASHTILIARDGRETHIDDSAAPIRDESGTLTGAVLVFRDIEERRALERQHEKTFQDLQTTLSKLQLAMEFAGQGSFYYDESTGMITVDTVVQELFELPHAAGPAEYWISKVHPEDQQRVSEAFAMAAAGGAPYALEHRIVRSDGVRWIDAKARVLSEPGKPMVFAGVCEDVTSRKYAEAALMQTEKLAAVGRLASTIAHEINNPLEAVTNLLYLARQAGSITEALPFLETADGELRRASTITNQALRFHKQATRPTSSTFTHLVEGAFTGRHARLQNAHAAEQLRDRTKRPVLCFEGEIRQVISNFVGNGIDALQTTGGKLHVRAKDGHDWRSGRSGMVITVADTGTGMSKVTRMRLFDAFFTTKGVGGTGLGLWISKEIVERHAGVMQLRSSQHPSHHGSVFTIFLPYEAVRRRYGDVP